MPALWFWELDNRDCGVWMPLYSGFPDYANGKFTWPHREPIAWVRIR